MMGWGRGKGKKGLFAVLIFEISDTGGGDFNKLCNGWGT